VKLLTTVYITVMLMLS